MELERRESGSDPAPVVNRSALIVRDARDDERDEIRDLTLRAYDEYRTVMAPGAWGGLAAAMGRALDRDDPGVQRIVAEREGVLVGSVRIYPPEAEAYGKVGPRAPWPEVRLLAIDPAARGHGIGRRLMDECIRRVRERGEPRIGIHTSASMRAAMEMYRRMGFARMPDHDFRPPGGELVEAYVLEIPPLSAPR